MTAKRHLPMVTTSEVKTFQQCQRKHHIRYTLGYKPVERPHALDFGTLVHSGLEAWWATAGEMNTVSRALMRAHAESKLTPVDLVRADVMMCGYHARWIDEPITVLGVEHEFRVPIHHPDGREHHMDLVGKFDALCTIDGRAYIPEHKCLAGSSRVFNHNTGTFQTMENMAREGIAPRVTALTESGDLVVAQATCPVPLVARETVRVTTASGRMLVASDNHPFWATTGWVKAGELRADDWVAAPKTMPSMHPGTELSDEAIRLLGYMIGDGSVSNMSFCKTDPVVLQDVIRCAAVVGENVAVRRYADGGAPQIYFSKVGPVAHLLKTAGVSGKAADKRAPQIPLSDRQCGQLLGALWSTDGCVDVGDGTKPRAIYTSVSERLCLDILELLQRLGIVASLNRTSVPYQGTRRPVFTVKVVSRQSKRAFARLVLAGIIPLLRSSVPIEKFEASISTSNRGSDSSLQPRLDTSIWWDRVVSVDRGEPETLYDMEVPGPHTFVAEGLITHNTKSEKVDSESYFEQLRADMQVSNYLIAATELGHDPGGALYDVLVKPDEPKLATLEESRKYTKEGKLYARQRDRNESADEYRERITTDILSRPTEFYQRATVVRLDAELDGAREDLWELADAVYAAPSRSYHPRSPDACRSFGRACEYWAICWGSVALEDSEKYVKLSNPYEEISEANVL